MREMWQNCEDLAASLTIPEPFDLQTFVDDLGERRGRPIEFIPLNTEPEKPCGLLASTDRADYIFYAANTTPLHRLHIQCHEIAHLLRGHTGTSALDIELAKLLMPSLPASVIERVLGRTVYSATQEHDAELLATLIMRRIGRTPSLRPPATPDITATLIRLSNLFDASQHQRRG